MVETDTGTWRRLALIPFPYHFVKSPEDVTSVNDKLGDATLRERLREDVGPREACLAWLIEGAVKSITDYNAFKRQPDRVAEATLAWRKTSDQILGYIDERLVFDADWAVLVSDMLDDFNMWLEGTRQKAWSSRTFAGRFGTHELVTSHGLVSKTMRRARAKNALSRRMGQPFPQGEGFRVWEGVRFTEHGGATAVSFSGSVTAVTLDSDEHLNPISPIQRGTDFAVTAVTPSAEPSPDGSFSPFDL